MKYLRCVAVLAGGVLALSGCTGTGEVAPPPTPAPAVSEAPAPPSPAPPPVEPVEQEPTDNCGLDPADMDEKTKVQCGLVVEEETTVEEHETTVDEETPPGFENEDLTFEERCRYWVLTAADGCSSADTPEDDGPGSLYTNPQTDCTWADNSTVYCEGPEGSYSYQEDPGDLPYYDTSGEAQHDWGCEQGHITEGC